MILFESVAPRDAVATETITLTFDTRCKARLRARLSGGEDCGIFLPRGTVLRGGDKLRSADGRTVEVIAANEPLIEARTADPLLLARAAYHLGNRHVALDLAAGVLRFPADHVLAEMVRGLGLEVAAVCAPFEPESGAYGASGAHGGPAHAHGHSTDGEGRGPRIHDHYQPR